MLASSGTTFTVKLFPPLRSAGQKLRGPFNGHTV